MRHALPDCIGITKVGDDLSEYQYLNDHNDELVGAPSPDGWFTSRWLDDSGAMFILSKHRDGYYNGSAHYAGSATTRLGDVAWIEDTAYFTASVLDGNVQATRLCAASGQFPYLSHLAQDDVCDAVITGLARNVTVYVDADAYDESPAGDWGPLDSPVEMPGGTMMDRMRFALGGFIPVGMFGDTNPMATFSGVVDEAFAYTVADTGATVHVAVMTVVDCMPVYVCWPEYLAPVPAVGAVISADAYLTAYIPALCFAEPDEPGR